MSFEVEGAIEVGAFHLDVAFATGALAVALIGSSGSGKTTLLNAIAGLIRPRAGRIAIAGQTLFSSADGVDLPAHRRELGYVFQQPSLFPHLSVVGNIRYGASYAKRTLASESDVVALMELQPLLRRRVGALSGGEIKRVAIARALMRGPRALLLDEPFAGLDQQRKLALYPFLQAAINQFRMPTLLVSHDASEVAALAEEVVEINGGRLRRDPA